MDDKTKMHGGGAVQAMMPDSTPFQIDPPDSPLPDSAIAFWAALLLEIV